MQPIAPWLELQYARAGAAMVRSISPVGIVKTRPGFGQTIRPLRGSIVASPVLAGYDPDPDYFFHWFRDSAVVLDALRLLYQHSAAGAEALSQLHDFVDFSLSVATLDGRALASSPAWRAAVMPDFVKFLRSDADLAAVHGDAVVGETRINPDASLDISSWARPQYDGPALRALTLLRWLRLEAVARAPNRLPTLLCSDLEFIARHWREPSFDIWEEEKGRHYYTLCVSAAALADGAAWLQTQQQALAQRYADEAHAIRTALDDFWDTERGYMRSRLGVERAAGTSADRDLDIAVVLAAIHAGGKGAHSAEDPRLQATLARLEALFDAAYQINHGRPVERAPAMGRYAGDVYYSGGAYYFSTLGAAEFCFRAAASGHGEADWFRRGDAYLETVRAYTPENGDMSEQFDQRTGAQTSARHLAWSYACFISTIEARRAAAGRPRPG